jgi:hypothetical protein
MKVDRQFFQPTPSIRHAQQCDAKAVPKECFYGEEMSENALCAFGANLTHGEKPCVQAAQQS